MRDTVKAKTMATEVTTTTTQALAPRESLEGLRLPTRAHLPDTRNSVTHKFSVCGHEGYLTVGLFEDGRPGELFIKMAKAGSTMAGMADTIGVLTSLALQYGVPVEVLARKFENVRFEPQGSTKNSEVGDASSLVDYIFRWLGIEFSDTYRAEHHHRGRAAECTD